MSEYSYLNEQKCEKDVFKLYENMGWNDYLQLDLSQLNQAMKNSYYVLYVYDDEKIIGTGRVISDGVINAYVCGVCVETEYRHQGIGKKIMSILMEKCKADNLHVQLFCEDHLVDYYRDMGLHEFAIGMMLE